MKKMVCLVLASLLCLNAAALAEYVPSKTTGDFIQIEATGENLPEDAGLEIRAVLQDEEEYQDLLTISQSEIEKLAATTVAEYFAEAKDVEEKPVDLAEMLGTEELKVYEFCPIIVNGYAEEYGALTVTLYFSTPYEVGQKVVVMIGLVNEVAQNMHTVEWTAYEGVGVNGELGVGIEVEVTPEVLLAIQDGMALLAVVSE